MSCTDFDHLVDYLTSESGPDVGIERHLEICEDCQRAAFLIRELRASLSPEVEVPESLIQRTLAALPEPGTLPGLESLPARGPVPALQLAASGVLGFLTACLAVRFGPFDESADPSLALATSLLVALGAVAVQYRAGGTPDLVEIHEA